MDDGRVKGLTVTDGKVHFVLEIDPKQPQQMQTLKKEAEARLLALPEINHVGIVTTSHRDDGKSDDPALQEKGAKRSHQGRASESASGPEPIPGINHIIAIASGKGGVGKSTLSANLACALAARGRRVGLLDADVYGPSQPRMLGVTGRPSSPDGKIILPLRHHGVTMMSIGLMTNEDQAVVWRGPMLMGALQQMMFQVQWGALDILLVDLPPGTGDVQMTLAQKVRVDGALIVSTPQDIALLDARKGIDMFQQMRVPLLGMIENMSTHICSKCGHEEHIFGHGGAQKEAERRGIPFLAAIPLDLSIRLASDGGAPLVVQQPSSPQTKAFLDIADLLVAKDVA
jgi:ATP-binding protein involved in chromosome partitioning